MRSPTFRGAFAMPGELVVDNFAGGGGASTGIEAAINRPVDIAINHSPEAIAMHKANHPGTKHYCENIWEVDPVEACAGRPVGLAWFSPDCTHFSRAKGTQPVKKEIRGLAWVVVRWAETVRPRVILLENVEEFQTWGPVVDGRPDPARMGETFREWTAKLTSLGYTLEFRTLVAADYGTPTTRKRLFLIARRDASGISWPAPTHGAGRAAPWRAAAEIIDWSLPCLSIFERTRPLADATLKRIATGIRRYILEAANPFVVPLTHQGDARANTVAEPLRTVTADHRGELALVEPFIFGVGGRMGQSPPRSVDRPYQTITAKGDAALAFPFLVRHGHYSHLTGAGDTMRGQRLGAPLGGVVLDPFAGSGTTCIAAALGGWRYLGIEQDAEFADVAARRIAHWTKPPAQCDLFAACAAEVG
ncbi:MAG: DNA cytosine methyltransferase [Myxococcales bacterium]